MTADAPSVPDSRALADEAVALVREWLVRAAEGRRHRDGAADRLATVLQDPHGLEFTVGFVDRVVRTVWVAGAALAAPMSDEDKAALQQQCAGDFTTFCAGLPPEDGPETQACFQKNMSKLSPGCQNAIQAYKKKG